eukprot:scaffold30226_cov34-Attheya_sp.AAC.1
MMLMLRRNHVTPQSDGISSSQPNGDRHNPNVHRLGKSKPFVSRALLTTLLGCCFFHGLGVYIWNYRIQSRNHSRSPSPSEAARADTNVAVDTVSAPTSPLQVRAEGVLSDYLSLLNEAYRRAENDFNTSHTRGERGVVIGPTEGKFMHTVKALQNAQRIRTVMLGQNNPAVKIALMTSNDHIRILRSCGSSADMENNPPKSAEERAQIDEGCRLWANGTLLDDIIATIDNEYKGNDNHTYLDQGSSFFMIKKNANYRHAPYTESLFLDTDAHPCPGFEKLFALVKEKENIFWTVPVLANADVAVGLEQYPHDPTSPHHFVPGDADALRDFFTFTYRNTGVVLFHFHSMISHVFAHFIPLVSEFVYNHVATERFKVVNDQTPFNIALYLFRRLVPEFLETTIPMHASCRSYPGKEYAGTDGFVNGMLPIQQDGKHCSECQCSPCLISHFATTWFLKVQGENGWEKK